MIARPVLTAFVLGVCLVAARPAAPSAQADAHARRGYNNAVCYYYIRAHVKLQAEWDYGDFLGIEGGPKVVVTSPFTTSCGESRYKIRQEFDEAIKAGFPEDWSKIEVWSSGNVDGAWIEKFELRAALGRARRKQVGEYRADDWVVVPFDFTYYGDG